ncbi:MAG: hypothetical protein SVV80_02190 [Planctomycetota bacterium]|nr:hypothetical protein [Planctomycetota bacterium]
MRTKTCLLVLAIFIAGCEVQDENPNWNPTGDYPSWTYDAPYYYRPSEDLPVQEVVGEGIPVYYTDSNQYFVKHSTGYQAPGVPRLAIWYSVSAGENWERAGYYGVEQTHFLFHADADGPHWVRFVGPGQGVAAASPGTPHRIYVVDTTRPAIEVSVDPPAMEKDKHGNKVPHIYSVGDTVEVRWSVSDANLVGESVRLATTFGTFPDNVVWTRFPLSLPATGCMKVPVPPEAAGRQGRGGAQTGATRVSGRMAGRMRFRIEAEDKAGNLNFAFSDILHVDGPPLPAKPIVRPVEPWELVAQTEGQAGPRPGWPQPGTLIRGGTSRMLMWLPDDVEKYENVVLQFSANNGRSWRTVAEDLKPDKTTKWTVPQINSKLCRLRILAVKGPDHRLMLAMTQAFIVHTAPPDTIIGPKLVPPEPREKPE